MLLSTQSEAIIGYIVFHQARIQLVHSNLGNFPIGLRPASKEKACIAKCEGDLIAAASSQHAMLE